MWRLLGPVNTECIPAPVSGKAQADSPDLQPIPTSPTVRDNWQVLQVARDEAPQLDSIAPMRPPIATRDPSIAYDPRYLEDA